jgi:hypothetical protein
MTANKTRAMMAESMYIFCRVRIKEHTSRTYNTNKKNLNVKSALCNYVAGSNEIHLRIVLHT